MTDPALFADKRFRPDPNVEADRIIARLDSAAIGLAATKAANDLRQYGVAAVQLTPGDATVYGFVILDQPRVGLVDSGGRFAIGSTFGKVRALPDPLGRLDYGYVEANYLDRRYANLHTAVVLATFVKAVAERLEL